MSAIRNPTELSADIMRTWSPASLGSRIVVTGTEAQSLEELSNHRSTPLGALLAIETVNKVRGWISCAKCTDPNFQPFSDAQVVCWETIQEFMDTLDHTIPLAWIHLGHGDFEYEINGEDEDDDLMFDSSDSMYKLLSLVLSDYITTNGSSNLSKYM